MGFENENSYSARVRFLKLLRDFPSREVFYTDIVKTYNEMKSAGVDVRLHTKEKMGHVYPLWPSADGKKARNEIAKIINVCL